MSDELERLSEVLDDLAAEREIALRRDLNPEEVELARTAAFLKAARAETIRPRPEFIEALATRLATGTGEQASAGPKPGVSRRGMLGRAAAAIAGLTVGGGATAKVAYEQGKQDGARNDATEALVEPMVPSDRGQWMDTGHKVAELPPNAAMRFRAGAVEGFVVNPGHGGSLYALSASCTHMGCAISWMPSSWTFICPCHGAQYNPDGTVLNGIARHPLPLLKIRHGEDGSIYVWSVPEHPLNSTLAPYSKA